MCEKVELTGPGKVRENGKRLYDKFKTWASDDGIKTVASKKAFVDKLKSFNVLYKKGTTSVDRTYGFEWKGVDLEKKFREMLGDPSFKIDWELDSDEDSAEDPFLDQI
jgi:phage/plasmid-associated DNA primase